MSGALRALSFHSEEKMNETHVVKIASELNVNPEGVKATAALL
ncbi:MAG: hypothetical protein H6Q51_1601, partial [Deltaproteobacteria bacterium]|nr:hypothetical protein [Deltaproteobacteria bacterium]